ncbi:MAG: hypothetical protein COV01_03530 [Candidatus Taylorbacteria bacterium CG10_big_fil_rev_8_21_14_0_10_41_48]|uniref:Glycosyltransferase 2-like domain-containing protein n=1 Tax=Candidatus Taylorbacteria bacterium CG10_big_fil_rev_8_21_14_0_10_41_48 TaxID=1975024 RepID=A0A2M8LB83_9BACT|nr:MAG: hypothetical protein COV01_03530 [Candidatus Taylorbacteria bacterium CG10_big_fil_rev_8_21_14_0_10_41_48]
MKPLISVIIPTYNCAPTIDIAIQSVLDQTWKNLEIIVVDDHSSDNTKVVVETLVKKDDRVQYHLLPFNDPHRVNKKGRNINAGYSARNFGLKQSKGDYITFQDADDASFANRIEIQYELLKKYNATHLCLDWQMFDEKYIGKQFNAHKFMKDNPGMIEPKRLVVLASQNKGIAYKIIGGAASKISFDIKCARLINKLFFGSLDGYPGTGNSPLFKREVIDKVIFRKLDDRVWPSFTGRGADRDFNFQVAETFRNSYVFFIPMYLWRQNKQNEKYEEIVSGYIID